MTTLESVQLIRDIVLIAVLGLFFLSLFSLSILGVLLYRRVAGLIDAAEETLRNADRAVRSFEEAATTASEGILKPAARAAALLRIGSLIGRLFGSGNR